MTINPPMAGIVATGIPIMHNQSEIGSIHNFIIFPSESLAIASDEAVLCNTCWIPFGISTKSFGGDGVIIDIDTNQSPVARDISVNHTIVEVPPNAIDLGGTGEIRYSIITDGEFKLPSGYKLGSMVVYLVCRGSKLKKPLTVHLPHWLRICSGTEGLVKCFRAPHSPACHTTESGGESYSFSLLDEDSYSITEASSVIQIDGVNCLFAVAYQEGVQQMYQYQVFDEVVSEFQRYVHTYVTYFSFTWQQVS